jgi:hypothetical protein
MKSKSNYMKHIFYLLLLSTVFFSCKKYDTNDDRINFLFKSSEVVALFVGTHMGNCLDADKKYYSQFEDGIRRCYAQANDLKPGMVSNDSIKKQILNMFDSSMKYDNSSKIVKPELKDTDGEYAFIQSLPVMKYLNAESYNISRKIQLQKNRFGIKD